MQEASTLSCKKGEIPKKYFTFSLYQAKTSRGWGTLSALQRRALSPAGSGDATQWAAPITDRRGSGDRPLGNVPPGRSGPQRGSQVGALLKVCRKPSLASPFGGGGLALARTERASCQRPLHMGCVEALAGCPLSRLTATAPPKGEPSLASPFGGGVMPKA